MSVPENPRTTLLLFTESYPYAVAMESTFIEPELPHLVERFQRVVVIPWRRGGEAALPREGVEVEDGLPRALERGPVKARMLAAAVLSRLFWSELITRPRSIIEPSALRRLAFTVGTAERARIWIDRYLASIDRAERTIAYTFWCDHITLALALAKPAHPKLVIASKAHGADLYAERHTPPYIPARPFTLRRLDGLFPDSERGVEYVREKHPWFASRCEAARMGVHDPGFVANPSPPGRCVVVSCSRMVGVKRVPLIAQAVVEAANRNPGVAFEWHHFGDGDLRSEVEARVRDLPGNASAVLHGYPSHAALMQFYRTHAVDVFVNASVSEGTSVAIMEAIACGIPVVATAVGGNVEIVSSKNGKLVPPQPSAAEIARAITDLVLDESRVARYRAASRGMWAARYDATANYRAFARRLARLTRSPT